MGYVFISYSTKNQATADSFRDLLNQNGIEIWMAPGSIPVGAKYAAVIGQAVRDCDCFVLLLSNDSQESPWVTKEVDQAVNYKRQILPIKLEELTLNDTFRFYVGDHQMITVHQIDERAPEIRQVLEAVRQRLSIPQPAVEQPVQQQPVQQQPVQQQPVQQQPVQQQPVQQQPVQQQPVQQQPVQQQPVQQQPVQQQPPVYLNGKSQATIAVMCFFLGVFGVHSFMMGEKKRGVFRIVLTLICIIVTLFVNFPIIFNVLLIVYDFCKILANKYIVDSEKLI